MAEPNETAAPRGTRAGHVRLRACIGRFLRDARGATAIEYAMIGGLVFAVAAGSIRLYGSRVNSVYERIGNAMAQIN